MWATFAANSPMKGYIRLPHRKLIAILLVDEFRTTMNCSTPACYAKMDSVSSPHLYRNYIWINMSEIEKLWKRILSSYFLQQGRECRAQNIEHSMVL